MRQNRLRYFIFVALMSLVFSIGSAVAQEEGEFALTILHTNDVHARVDQFDSGGNSCDEEEATADECVGGAARVKAAADAVRGEVANSVLVDAGDQFQGTLFFNQYQGGAVQEMMNLLGYDAMTIGNHEFDSGPGTLGSFLRSIDFSAVSANIDASAEPELAGLIQPYTVLDVNGEQVGVVGVTTVETGILSSPGPNVTFSDAAPSVQAAVDELTGQDINKIVVLSHMGYLADQDLASVVTGVDVIVGGHSHTVLSNTDADAAGPYPTVVDATDGSPVLIVSNGSYARTLGRLDVSFDADGVVTEYSGDPIALDSSVTQDEAVQTRVQALGAPLEALKNEVIGSATVDLDGDRTTCRFGECTMGNLITDAMLWKTQDEGTQLAITNGGGIRASIQAGDVTVGDVLTVLPFGNLISTFELSGADVVQALENGVSRAENPENEGTGRFPQVSGLRYSWDPAQPVGSRITSVEVKNADGSYSPIDTAATYKVASNDFMRGGGDGYEVFVTAANAYDFGPSLDEAVQEYIAQNSPVAPEPEGRITQGDGAEMMAEGEETMAEGEETMAEGEETMAEGEETMAEGEEAMAEEGAMMAEGCAENYTVQADDWLSKIAERFLGDVLAYQTIADATNAAAAAGGNYTAIADPNVIEVGQILCIPSQEGAMMEEGAAMEGEAAMAESTEEAAMAEGTEEAAMAEGSEEAAMAEGTEEAAMAEGTEEAAMAEGSEEMAAEEDHGEAPHWTYEGELGPEFWGNLSDEFALCASGTSQSPIDISSSATTKTGEITFDYQPSAVNVLNNGHTIQINYDPGSTMTYNDNTYELKQFHFHAPSEHTMDSQPANMEAHLVHADPDDNLAVLGVWLDQGEANPVLAQFWDQIPTEEGEATLEGTVSAIDLLPVDSDYFSYSGSLTTPPCSEGVSWVVLNQRQQVSQDQVDKFVEVIGNNARPVQPLNDRQISQ